MDYKAIGEKTEKMCRKCRYITPADVAILMECAWETERDEKSKKEIENNVLRFKKCFDDGTDVCEKAEWVCVFAETREITWKEEKKLRETITEAAMRAGRYTFGIFFSQNREDKEVKLTIAQLPCCCPKKGICRALSAEKWKEETSEFIVEKFADQGDGVCTPYILGVGVGNSVEEASLLAFRAALVRNAGSASESPEGHEIEKKLLRRLNRPKTGYACIGGHNTVLSLNVEISKDELKEPFCMIFPACFALGRQKMEL